MRRFLLGAGFLAVASSACAITSVYSQPYLVPAAGPGLPAWVSQVKICDQPNVAAPRICLDDFKLAPPPTGGNVVPISRVDWWGNLFVTAQQTQRPYAIAFYTTNPDKPCFPFMAQPLVVTCVVPRVAQVTVDCKGYRVFRFYGLLAAPISLPANTPLWIEIAEDDSRSARQVTNDFRWSAYQKVRNCPAVMVGPTGAMANLTDPCNQQKDDLSFVLYRP